MSFRARPTSASRMALVALASLFILCGCVGSADKKRTIAWQDVPPTPQPTAEALDGVGGLTAPLPPTQPELMTPEQLRIHAPNELGHVPILMYHVITTLPELSGELYRTVDDFRSDLQWLYDNNYYIVSMTDVVRNEIDAPMGKKPIVLTFDDANSMQFSFIETETGELVPDPTTAVGIMEEFYAAHPDFGRGGYFAIVPGNAFAWPDDSQRPYFDQKIQFLIDHGYEISNHTLTHTDLTDVSTEHLLWDITEPIIWADSIMGADHPQNASRILTLPYGASPDVDLHPDQRDMLRHGYWYNGQFYQLEAVLLAGANPAYSPASNIWDPVWVPRIGAFQESMDHWFSRLESGEVTVYVSDGNPSMITVPSQLPADVAGQLDVQLLAERGKTIAQYDPHTGELAQAPGSVVASGETQQAVVARNAVARRGRIAVPAAA